MVAVFSPPAADGHEVVDPDFTQEKGASHPVSGGEWVGQSPRMEGFPPRVEFCALGPVGVIVEAQPVPTVSPKLRMVLAALLVEANSVVSSDRLIDVLWGDDPPVSARATLQKLVYRLRLLVEPDRSADHLIVTRAPGYMLRVGPEEYDAARFEDRMRTARAQATKRAASAAVATLDEALGLWRGPAFAESRTTTSPAPRLPGSRSSASPPSRSVSMPSSPSDTTKRSSASSSGPWMRIRFGSVRARSSCWRSIAPGVT